MARTRQTARRSTGGGMMGQRHQQAVFINPTTGGSEHFGRQVDVFQERGSRTILVEGTAESAEKPNVIHLSFLIVEAADTIQAGIVKVGRVIAQVRKVASSLGVPNEQVFSDSISSQKIREQVGYYEKNNDDDDEDFRIVETKISFKVKSVVRIVLEGNDELEKTFSRLCFELMTKLGLRSHQAPVYELDNINEIRNAARKDAMENAKGKAVAILEALSDETVSLGSPIAVTDVPCSLQDDAEDSFLGNWGSVLTSRTVVPQEKVVAKPSSSDPAEDGEPSPKRARTVQESFESTELTGFAATATESTKNKKETSNDDDDNKDSDLDAAAAESIFVAPTIRVAACVRVLFNVNVYHDAQTASPKASKH